MEKKKLPPTFYGRCIDGHWVADTNRDEKDTHEFISTDTYDALLEQLKEENEKLRAKLKCIAELANDTKV